ncbi:ubiquitin carboxyl-terminal hydrolase 10-B-like [Hydra vulgaris]|uniref:ubiquitinyl hydrolase 1 n=1 Tax=Hydra vulgaris TaxID=6087 RepID=A0ABM4DKR0_HYDVU
MNPNDGTLFDVNKPLLFGDFEINEYIIYFQHAEVEKIGVEFLCGDLHNSTQAWVNEVGSIKDLESENDSFGELSNNLHSIDQITISDKYGSQENIEFLSEKLLKTNEVNTEIKSFESSEPSKNRSSWASLFNSSTAENSSSVINNEKIISVQMETHNVDVKNCITVVGMENDARAIRLAKSISNLKIDFSCHHLQLRGLINRGNWCYINTTLQALLAISPISHFYKSLKAFLNTDVSYTSTPLTDSMIAFFNEFESINPKISLKKQSEDIKTGASFEPRCIYNVLTTMKASLSEKGRQEDAEEFLSYLLNGIHDELVALNKLLSKKPQNGNPDLDNENDDSSWSQVGTKKKDLAKKINSSSDSTIIKQIFGGMIRSSVQQSGVKESTTLQPFFTLQLDIQGDEIWCLEKAIESYFVKEILQGFTCSKTNTEVEASRKLSIEELPLVLIFHLKYFVYDRTGGSQKIYKAIDIPVDLEIPKDVLSPSLKVSLNERQYRLYAVIHHHGKHAAGGHYTASVHHSSPFGWVNFDDNMIKTLNVNQVLRKQQGSVPYLLFYERCQR